MKSYLQFLISPFFAAILSIGISWLITQNLFRDNLPLITISVVFNTIVHLITNITLVMIKKKNTEVIKSLMPIPIIRLLFAGTMFLIATRLFTEKDLAFLSIHFVCHYLIFILVEVIFLSLFLRESK